MNKDLQNFDYQPADKLGKLLRGPRGFSTAGARAHVAPTVPTPMTPGRNPGV